MIFVANAIFSQKLPENQRGVSLLQKPFYSIQAKTLLVKHSVILSNSKKVISPDFYVRQLPFFCRQEIKFEKATRIPFRFRVGSIEDCDRMEGKFKRN
jgi:hypothetical protein